MENNNEPRLVAVKGRQIIFVIAGGVLLTIICFLVILMNARDRAEVNTGLVLAACVILLQVVATQRVASQREEMTDADRWRITAAALADLPWGLGIYYTLVHIPIGIFVAICIIFPSMFYNFYLSNRVAS